MKAIATLLLVVAAAYCAPAAAAPGPTPSKSESKAAKKKGLSKMFAKRQQESAYAKAMRRNELFR